MAGNFGFFFLGFIVGVVAIAYALYHQCYVIGTDSPDDGNHG
jgi:hypothetical protein